MSKIGERLTVAVNQAGGPSKVSRATGIPLATLNDVFKRGDLKVSTLVKISDACSVSIEWLATGRGEIAPAQRKLAVNSDLERDIGVVLELLKKYPTDPIILDFALVVALRVIG